MYLYDEGENAGNRVFEINKNVHEGTHQLEYWFTRQRNRWASPRPGQDWFGEGSNLRSLPPAGAGLAVPRHDFDCKGSPRQGRESKCRPDRGPPGPRWSLDIFEALRPDNPVALVAAFGATFIGNRACLRRVGPV